MCREGSSSFLSSASTPTPSELRKKEGKIQIKHPKLLESILNYQEGKATAQQGVENVIMTSFVPKGKAGMELEGSDGAR